MREKKEEKPLELVAVNHLVGGSNPSRGANFFWHLCAIVDLESKRLSKGFCCCLFLVKNYNGWEVKTWYINRYPK